MKKRTTIKTDLFADESHRKKIDTLDDPLVEIESYSQFGVAFCGSGSVGAAASQPAGAVSHARHIPKARKRFNQSSGLFDAGEGCAIFGLTFCLGLLIIELDPVTATR